MPHRPDSCPALRRVQVMHLILDGALSFCILVGRQGTDKYARGCIHVGNHQERNLRTGESVNQFPALYFCSQRATVEEDQVGSVTFCQSSEFSSAVVLLSFSPAPWLSRTIRIVCCFISIILRLVGPSPSSSRDRPDLVAAVIESTTCRHSGTSSARCEGSVCHSRDRGLS